ncbi:MAG: hypothetical protein M4579_006858 [Chaenotheca gracillima]|nr:MAG: hypothetical protein M4579_006858 [Chaenotheca gracillima]
MRPRAPSGGAAPAAAAAVASPTSVGGISRSRKSSASDVTSSTSPSQNFVSMATPTPRLSSAGAGETYFLTDEKGMEEALLRNENSPGNTIGPSGQMKGKKGGLQGDSSYGVHSLAETIGGEREEEDEEDEEADGEVEEDDEDRKEVPSAVPAAEASPSAAAPHALPPTVASALSSRPLTPISLVSPMPGSSLASSPRSTSTKSLRPSDLDSGLDDVASQALASSGEESDDEDEAGAAQAEGNPLQLIMPSIKMPSRRPFSERGKNMGRLKVLIAGGAGVGKTSLIKSIVQTCEDIVHVDPLVARPPSLSKPPQRRSKSKGRASGGASGESIRTREITEIHASTRPYPTWWSEFDQGKILRRRKSMGDAVLERNLCFVDTPGFGHAVSLVDSIEPIVRYIETQMERTASLMSGVDGDALGLLSGNGGTQVDAVFYVVAGEVSPADVEFFRRLSTLTNVIPIIAKTDTQSPETTTSLKHTLLKELQHANIQPFLFGRPLDEVLRSDDPSPPYAISCATTSDADNMDASLLMSPDYMQPLLPTELQTLVERVFDQDSIAWLRHAAALKFIQWRNRSTPPLSQNPYISNNHPGSQYNSSHMISGPASPSTTSFTSPSSSYALARVADHTQREEHLAQIRLARWADDLQRGLANERRRYEALARGEHALWLQGRIGDHLLDGTLSLSAMEESMALVHQRGSGNHSHPAPPSSTDWPTSPSAHTSGLSGPLTKQSPSHFRGSSLLDPRDPLGLLDWNDKFWRRGWVAVKIVGTFGVMGGLFVWFARGFAGGTEGVPLSCTGNGNGGGGGGGTWGWNWGCWSW